MGFRVGQRVRAIAVLTPSGGQTALWRQHNAKYAGSLGTIVSEGQSQNYGHHGDLWSYQVRWDKWGMLGFEPAKCLAPIDDDADFKRFMDDVLKPLKEPVAA